MSVTEAATLILLEENLDEEWKIQGNKKKRIIISPKNRGPDLTSVKQQEVNTVKAKETHFI